MYWVLRVPFCVCTIQFLCARMALLLWPSVRRLEWQSVVPQLCMIFMNSVFTGTLWVEMWQREKQWPSLWDWCPGDCFGGIKHFYNECGWFALPGSCSQCKSCCCVISAFHLLMWQACCWCISPSPLFSDSHRVHHQSSCYAWVVFFPGIATCTCVFWVHIVLAGIRGQL